jgi:HlyD family secretion protein
LVVGAGAGFVWWKLTRSDLPEGFAQTNGRLEATKIYITTKAPLRVEKILVKEGDYVKAGQIVARMDTRTLQAQYSQAKAKIKQAEAQFRQAEAKIQQAKAQFRQAQAKIQQAKDAKATADDQRKEREADLVLAKSQLERTQKLRDKGGASQAQLDVDIAKHKTSRSALDAAKSQVVESQSAINAAIADADKSQSAINGAIADADTSKSAIDAAIADADRLRVDVEDGVLKAPRHGRIQYRMAEEGEVLPAGGRVLDMIDLTDVYMLCYLPEDEAGKATIGGEARLVFDALPDDVIPATVYFVAAEAQFTPKAVETRTERQKLAFQVRARIDPDLLDKYEPYVKTGLPGVIYIRLDPKAQWPERLHVRIKSPPGVKP